MPYKGCKGLATSPATAVTDVEREGIPLGEALVCAARLVGQDLGRQARQPSGVMDSRPALLAAVLEVLHDFGYKRREVSKLPI